MEKLSLEHSCITQGGTERVSRPDQLACKQKKPSEDYGSLRDPYRNGDVSVDKINTLKS